MARLTHRFVIVALTLFLAACATLSPTYETPQVSLTSFTVSPQSSGLAPEFDIGLRVVNPNRSALPLVGMSYSVEVDGNRILTGAEPNLPRIEGYGTADIIIKASPDLFGSARLINQLLTSTQSEFNYLFKAKLDVGTLMPFIHIEEKGSFGLPSK